MKEVEGKTGEEKARKSVGEEWGEDKEAGINRHKGTHAARMKYILLTKITFRMQYLIKCFTPNM